MIKDILTIQQPESGDWACSPGVGISGNQTLDQVVQRIEQGLSHQSDKPGSFGNWKAEGKRYDLDNTLLEECDRWHLSRYEVFTTTDESNYQAIVMLYYEPAVKVAIAA